MRYFNRKSNSRRGAGRQRQRSSRPCCFERLEQRWLLYGLTVITHGNMSDAADGGWVDHTADDMASRIGAEFAARGVPDGCVAQYKVILKEGSSNTPVFDSWPQESDCTYQDANTGETILKIDWSDLTGASDQIQWLPGWPVHTPTGQIAEEVADFLFSNDLTEAPIHLIGHSRGASVNVRLASLLGEQGVWVDQVTSLDPHPVDGTSGGDVLDWDDQPMVVWENVAFADNYWREDGLSGELADVDGEFVGDAYNVNLRESYFEDAQNRGYDSEHGDVHAWYHGTINLASSVQHETSENWVIDDSWYLAEAYVSSNGDLPSARAETGYAYSRIVGDTRPAVGLSTVFGGDATRTSLSVADAPFANIGYLTLDRSEAGLGDAVNVQYAYEVPSGKSAGIAFLLDDNQNPYDGHRGALGGLTVNTSGYQTGSFMAAISTDTSPGDYFVYAQITCLESGETRYDYARQRLTIASAAPDIDVEWSGNSDNTHAYDFGIIPVYTNRLNVFTVRNEGDARLTVSGISGPGAPFIVIPANGPDSGDDWVIAAGGTKMFTAVYVPTDSRSDSGTLTLESNDLDESSYQIQFSARAEAGWTNPAEPMDVNGDGVVKPQDVVILVNEINTTGSRILPARTALNPGPPCFLDANGDGKLTPADALVVINRLNSLPPGAAEGESLPRGESMGLVAEVWGDSAENRVLLARPAPIWRENIGYERVRFARREGTYDTAIAKAYRVTDFV